MYGLKGMAAYLEHAMRLGHNDESIHRFNAEHHRTNYNKIFIGR